MSKDKKNVPKIRFPGFTEPWEERKLGEIAINTYGGGTPTTSNERYWDGDIPWIQSSDLTENKVSGVIPRKYITEEGLRCSATKLVSENSIAIITRVGVGKLAVMPFSYTTSQDFLSLSNLNTDIWFSVYAIYKKLQRELNAVQGTSIKGITKQELLSKVILIPEMEEQLQIGQFFQEIDHLITLHQRKLNNIQNLKAGLLQKMFPKNGEVFPEVRFPGFTEPWEQCKFGDILKNHAFRPYLAEANEVGTYKVIQQGDKSIIGYADGEPFINFDAVSLFGDHTVSLYKPTEPFFVATDGVKILSAEGFDGKYLYTLLECYKPESQGYKRHFTILKNKDAWVTKNSHEQAKIGQFFENLDHLITLHHRKLEHLQEQKKSLLQDMFV